MAWDRYAYVNSNPLRYTDPTGHRLDDGCNTEGCATNLSEDETLKDAAVYFVNRYEGDNDLEVFARIVEMADLIYAPEDMDGFLNGINLVIVGGPYETFLTSEAGMYYHNDRADSKDAKCLAVGRFCDADGDNQDDGIPLKATGYKWVFRDGSNQAFHFWSSFVSVVEHPVLGANITGAGNIFHEVVQPILKWDSTGASLADFSLTTVGIHLGGHFSYGWIERSELGETFRNWLGD